ncbi:AAA family ATPase [Kribbella albertanoniae]|uniref:ATP-binding protein n=1 Tax=Kribbella albertanoniae TaxID=1266829 RepID=UPI001404D002|nr:AAA family ATPase [Kribbella albertanoniae]
MTVQEGRHTSALEFLDDGPTSERDRPLLERVYELAVLAESARQAMTGRGQVVLVSGEAGIGKSRLVEAAREQLSGRWQVLIGHCDDLAIARVLGPFHDLVGSVGSELTNALRAGADRDEVLSALRAELSWSGRPTLLVIEDVQWADDASIDALQYLVRRLGDLPVVLVLTYRDGELAAGHPVRRLVGSASGVEGTRHLPLRALSIAAIRELCRSSVLDARQVYDLTGGNPFYVSEVLAAGSTSGVPRRVADTVLSRIRDLDRVSREVIEQLALVPAALDKQLADRLVGDTAALMAAEERGLLEVTASTISFPYELVRRAIADSIPAVRRSRLHGEVLKALLERTDADLQQIMYHARESGDGDVILRYGGSAAQAATHREAAGHYGLMLEYASALPAAALAGLLESYANECYIVGDGQPGIEAIRRAIDLRQELDDPTAVGEDLWLLSRLYRSYGVFQAATSSAVSAVAVLEPLGASRSLARGYANLAGMHLASLQPSDALRFAERAVAMARLTVDEAVLPEALNALGSVAWDLPDVDAQSLLKEGLEVAVATGHVDAACHAFAILGRGLADRFRLDEAESYVHAGLELAQVSGHLGWLAPLRTELAMIEASGGAWDNAVSLAEEISADQPAQQRSALTVLGRVAARRGSRDSIELLASAARSARDLGDMRSVASVAAAEAEAAWLRGDTAEVVRIASTPFQQAVEEQAATVWPELGYWLTCAGRQVEMPASDNPYALLASGRWQEAAGIWLAGGCRYEYAMALCESSEAKQLLLALDDLTSLGGRPLAAIARRRLRDLGVSQIPRGRPSSTRDNPAGLTSRQLEVLQLLVDGLADQEIAEQLVISVRTASNHVAAVLDKLGVHSRSEAARLGVPLLLTPTARSR